MNKNKVGLNEELLKAKKRVEVTKKVVRDSVKELKKKYPEYFEKDKDKNEES